MRIESSLFSVFVRVSRKSSNLIGETAEFLHTFMSLLDKF